MALALSKTDFPVNSSEELKVIDIGIDKSIKSMLFTPSVEKIVNQLVGLFTINSINYYEKIPGHFCELNQSGNSKLELIVLLSQPKSKEFSLHIIPGSHKKLHSESERATIVENCNPVTCSLNLGGAIIVNSNIIKRFSGSLKKEIFRFLKIEIESASKD